MYLDYKVKYVKYKYCKFLFVSYLILKIYFFKLFDVLFGHCKYISIV